MKAVPWLLLIAMLALAAWALDGRDKARGERAALQARVDSLAVVQARVDTVYRADTVRLWRTLTHYDSVRTTDTLTRNDTVFVHRAVADDAVAACRVTVRTCEERVAVRDARIAALDSLTAATARALTASERKARRDKLLFGGAGLLLGWLAKP